MGKWVFLVRAELCGEKVDNFWQKDEFITGNWRRTGGCGLMRTPTSSVGASWALGVPAHGGVRAGGCVVEVGPWGALGRTEWQLCPHTWGHVPKMAGGVVVCVVQVNKNAVRRHSCVPELCWVREDLYSSLYTLTVPFWGEIKPPSSHVSEIDKGFGE